MVRGAGAPAGAGEGAPSAGEGAPSALSLLPGRDWRPRLPCQQPRARWLFSTVA